MAVFVVLAYAFGLRKVHCFYKKIAKLAIESNESLSEKDRRRLEMWKKSGKAQKHQSPSIFGGSLAVGMVAGVVSFIGFTITGTGMDFMTFLWAALYSGLFSGAGYPNFWIYIVGPAMATFGTGLFWSMSLRSIHWDYESMKVRYREKLTYVISTYELAPGVEYTSETSE
jgi:hypothetical protein